MTSRKAFRTFAVGLVLLVFSLPFVFLVLGSLRPPGLPPAEGFEFIPYRWRWGNYESVSFYIPLFRYLRNSMIVVAIAVPLTVLVASWAGFVIVAGSRRLRRFTLIATLVSLMVPLTALWVPRFVLFERTGLTDTLLPLILPALMATSPFFVLVFALVYSRIPRELFEAAESEGLTSFRTWATIAWPLGYAGAIAVAVLAFAAHWASFMEPLLYLSNGEHFTLPVGLRALHALEPTKHSLLLAGSVIATVPVVLCFILGQRVLFRRILEV
jgi:multiple sugar transport system permease protein